MLNSCCYCCVLLRASSIALFIFFMNDTLRFYDLKLFHEMIRNESNNISFDWRIKKKRIKIDQEIINQ